MKIKQMLKQAIELQNKLNSKIDKDWKNNRSMTDFNIAILQEVSELIDSYSWAWWKQIEENDFNKRVELVDIFHFLLSKAILYQELYPEYNISNDIINAYYDELNIRKEYENESDLERILYFVKWSIYDNTPNFYQFFDVVVRYFTSLEEFLKWYFVKNVLNEIRQLKGYKTGEYKKVVEGMEDNEIIYKLAEKVEFTDFEEFRDNLLQEYIYYTSARQEYI